METRGAKDLARGIARAGWLQYFEEKRREHPKRAREEANPYTDLAHAVHPYQQPHIIIDHHTLRSTKKESTLIFNTIILAFFYQIIRHYDLFFRPPLASSPGKQIYQHCGC
jgi:hypothetical protein